MIIVSGTKRSGTSMWMQILVNGGFPYIGEAFPQDWGNIIRDANPEGFYESALAGGIWWRTNPSPRTGAWLHPRAVENYAVKVFPRGLVRTDYAYIGRVIATMREWRQYEASVRRLFRIQAANRGREYDEARAHPLPPGFEWWLENYELIRDIATRRYAVHMLSYASLLADPERAIAGVFDWIGAGDKAKAAAAVQERLNTQRSPEAAGYDSEFAWLFDELYDRIHRGQPLDRAFIDTMNDSHRRIVEIAQELAPNYLRQRQALDALAPQAPQDDGQAQQDPGEQEQTRQQRPGRQATSEPAPAT